MRALVPAVVGGDDQRVVAGAEALVRLTQDPRDATVGLAHRVAIHASHPAEVVSDEIRLGEMDEQEIRVRVAQVLVDVVGGPLLTPGRTNVAGRGAREVERTRHLEVMKLRLREERGSGEARAVRDAAPGRALRRDARRRGARSDHRRSGAARGRPRRRLDRPRDAAALYCPIPEGGDWSAR